MWDVKYTNRADLDLQGIYEYIAFELKEPVTAKNQSHRIMDVVDTLDELPLRHRLYDKEPWHSRGLRVMPVDNFVVFYLPVESRNTVAIIRIMYGGRDVDRHLNQTEEYSENDDL